MDLRNKHVISLTIQNGRPITRPDRIAKLVKNYVEGTGYSRTHNESDWFLDNDGFPLAWDQVQIEDPVRAQAIQAADANNDPPTPTYIYGNTPALRKAAHADYISDQKSLLTTFNAYKEEVTKFFEVLRDHCTPVGREVYRQYLPNEDHQGDTRGAWLALTTSMGVNDPANIQGAFITMQKLTIIKEGNLPSYFAALDASIRTLTLLGQPPSDEWIKGMIIMKVKDYHNHDTQPYQSTLDTIIHNPAFTLQRLKEMLVNKEQDLLSHYPFTSNGKLPIKAGGPSKVRARAYETDYEDHYVPPNVHQTQVQPKTFNGRCSICKETGHMTKECPQGTWCEECRWVHRNNQPCDKGVAKREWLKNQGNPRRNTPTTNYPKSGGGSWRSGSSTG
mgnify:CR=1 FL=1